MNIPENYYVEEDFRALAGPYDPRIEPDKTYMRNVVNDMESGNVSYRVVKLPGARLRVMIERRGMILPVASRDE